MKQNKISKPRTKPLNPLPIIKLRHVCNPKLFKFANTKKLPNLNEIIGQDRATHALMFGLDIDNHNYNIYALGPVGTGKSTIIRKYLLKEAASKATPSDWLYVNNFENVDKPKKLQLPAGKGRELRDDMDQFVLELKTEVPKAFESEAYVHEYQAIENEFRTQTEEILKNLAKKAEKHEFRLIQTSDGFAVLPTHNNKILTNKEAGVLTDKKLKEIDTNKEMLIKEVQEKVRLLEQLRKESRKKLIDLDQHIIGFSINHIINTLKNKYKDYPAIQHFLTEAHNHLLKHVQAFKHIKQTEEASIPERLALLSSTEATFEEYKVNLIVDNSETVGAPVIFEKNPIGPNLIGRIEQQGWFGTLTTNFRMIKAGTLHRANGGYLILDILDILKKPFVWEILKRALKSQEITIESMIEALGAFTTRTLEPEPIPLRIKVILIGNPMFYYLIYALDPEFQELFKIKADFATQTTWNNKSIHQYAQFISMVCREENLLHFNRDGVAKIIEYGARLVEHQNKVSLKFGDIVDIIRQASYWAKKHKNALVGAADVQKALEEKIYRANRIAGIIREMITEQTIKISVKGQFVGQINGLSVLTLGDYSFGKPSRITVQTYVGRAGIINIEKETKLGGKIHNKGTMIVTGYLGGKYGQNYPLSFSGSITLEQLYEEVEGDSASAAEIYALLSSLSGYPLRQDLAVTGSVNQHGEIQAIGGINEKIEGFYQVCKVLGLTGKQGVIIPESNVRHLMLHESVIAAVKSGKFHIYAIKTIDEGLELLTGKPAGKSKADGTFPNNTVNWAVQQRIIELGEKTKPPQPATPYTFVQNKKIYYGKNSNPQVKSSKHPRHK
jgi:lon-related putative ATP-dependent protease